MKCIIWRDWGENYGFENGSMFEFMFCGEKKVVSVY